MKLDSETLSLKTAYLQMKCSHLTLRMLPVPSRWTVGMDFHPISHQLICQHHSIQLPTGTENCNAAAGYLALNSSKYSVDLLAGPTHYEKPLR